MAEAMTTFAAQVILAETSERIDAPIAHDVTEGYLGGASVVVVEPEHCRRSVLLLVEFWPEAMSYIIAASPTVHC